MNESLIEFGENVLLCNLPILVHPQMKLTNQKFCDSDRALYAYK